MLVTKGRPLVQATYAVAALLIVSPLFDLITTVWPLRPGEVSWRFGTVGLLTNTLVTPILGALLVMLTAGVLEHRRVLRTAAYVDLIALGVILLAIVAFVLDYLQLRRGVAPNARRAYDLAAYKAMVGGTLAMVVLGWLGLVGLGVSKRSRGGRGNENGTIVGTITD